MSDGIRNLRIEDYDTFVRVIERAFGMARGVLEAGYPHLYRPTPELCAASFVMEQDGQIVSHVGVYPIEVEIYGVAWPIAGIGAVGTLPEARGKGYMTQLLYHAVDVMRERGYVLSWLGGDRQRYNTFGCETVGQGYELTFTRHSLDRAGVEPVEVHACDPKEAVPIMEALQETLVCRVIRADLATQLHKQNLGIWTTKDGYVLVHGRPWGPLYVAELASAAGRPCPVRAGPQP